MRFISRQFLLDKLAEAARSDRGFLELRDLIFDYYAGEEAFSFQSQDLELIFAGLLHYLQFEEAFGDSNRQARLARLDRAIQRDLSPESVIAALEYDRISELLQKVENGLISEVTFYRQLKKISAVPIDWKKALSLQTSL